MGNLDIAITGMDCVFPGAVSLRQFRRVLFRGRNCITPIPAKRLNGLKRIPGVATSPESDGLRGGFLPDPILFSPLDYQIIPQIVPEADPDQFLMLRVVARALHDAGIDLENPVRNRTDLIVGRGGYMTNQMSELFLKVDLRDRLIPFLQNGVADLTRQQLDQISEKLAEFCPDPKSDEVSTCIPNLVASRTANRLDLRGAAYTVDAACASSLVAVDQCIRRLANGDSDLAIAGGIHLLQTPSFWSIFGALGAISPTQQVRPFDRRADGLLIGEGAGAVVLKRLDDAIADQDEVYAVIRGVGISNDGNQTSLLTPSSPGQIAALRDAYEKSQIDPSTVGFLEAHGTGTSVGDTVELETIQSVYGSGNPAATRALGSVKSMIGHTMPASGMASLIKATLSLHHRCLFQSLNCDNPHPGLKGSAFYVNRTTRPWIHDRSRGPRRAGVNSFGFGGVNCHVILEEANSFSRTPSTQKPEPRQPNLPGIPGATELENRCVIRTKPTGHRDLRESELFLLAGQDNAELITRVGQLKTLAEEMANQVAVPEPAENEPHDSEYELLDLAFTWNQNRDSGKSRIAMIAVTIEDLCAKLDSVKSRLEQGDAIERIDDIYSTEAIPIPTPKVAGIFPGLGFPGLIGNYPNHLMETCLHFPEVRREFDKIEHRDEDPADPLPTSLIFMPPQCYPEEFQQKLRKRLAPISNPEAGETPSGAADDRNLAAAGITVSNWVSWRILQELEVPFDMACGQSQGEMAAMCAANMMDFDDIVPRFWIDRAEDYEGRGCLAFVTCNEKEFHEHAKGLGEVSIAIHVAPEMLIVGGTIEELEILAERIKRNQRIANLLPYPPIHTRRLSHMREHVSREFQNELEFRKPTMRVYSSITQEPFPDDREKIWELMLSNLDSPVRFWQCLQQMYDDDARIFVQVGGGSMAANIKTVLEKPDMVATAVDVDHRTPLTQIQHLCAVLFTNGIEFNPAYLYKYTDANRFDPAKAANPNSMQIPLRLDWTPFDKPAVPATSGEPLTAEGSLRSGEQASGLRRTESIESAPIVEKPSYAFIGDLEFHDDGLSVTNRLELDLEEHLFLHDHAVVDPASQKPVENRLAVLPVTLCMEMIGETAAMLTDLPCLTGLDNISAKRWIDFPDVQKVSIEIKARIIETGGNTERISVEVYADSELKATGTAVFTASYLLPAEHAHSLEMKPLINERPWVITAQDSYQERHLFHGPRFQCIQELQTVADNGMWGKIQVASTDRLFASNPNPVFLTDPIANDGMLQLSGIWSIAHGFYVLPAAISRMSIHASTPEPGTVVDVRMTTVKIDKATRGFVANLQVFLPDGTLWMTLEGLREWIFDYTTEFQDTQRLPCHFCVSQPVASSTSILASDQICARVDRSSFRNVNLDWLARLYLHVDEFPDFRELQTLNRKWDWLMGRIAAKDALRLLLRSGDPNRPMLHPATIVIKSDDLGKPRVTSITGWNEEGRFPEISISHTSGSAIALVSPVVCGVDAEPLDRDIGELASQFMTDSELELLKLAEMPNSAPTLFWCAKEAMAKAMGTGMKGRPKDFEVISMDGYSLTICHSPTGQRGTIHLIKDGDLIIALVLSRKRRVRILKVARTAKA